MWQRTEPTSFLARLRSGRLPGIHSRNTTSGVERQGPLFEKQTTSRGISSRPTDGAVTAKWSTGSRIVGSDGKNAWVIAEGAPVCVAVDRLRPCTAAEALAYQYLSKHRDGGVERYAPPDGQQ
eukprot:9287425-Pyramimonas_sp.AAC.1